MSLRDEIYKIVDDVWVTGKDEIMVSETPTYFTDEIMKAFENRINLLKINNTPRDFKKVKKKDQERILYYLLALDNVKELLNK